MGNQSVQRNRVRIVTDTTASLPAGYAQAHALEVVPQVIIFGAESYLEDYELTSQEFIRRLKSSSVLPKTAAPPPGTIIEAYRRLLAQADTIVSIHPSADVSGTIRSAQTAMEEFPGADIRILDMRTLGGNLGAMVMSAVEWAESGAGADEIVERLQAMIPRSRTYFVLRTLEYLQKGGRIGGAAALMGSLLQIKPILEIRGGRVEVLEKVRVQNRAVERLVDLVVQECPRSREARLCVMHADAPEDAQRVVAALATALGLDDIPLYHLGAAITTHGGPGTLGVGFFVD